MVALDILKPSDVEGIFTSPFFVHYWPSIIGTILFFLCLRLGWTWTVVPIVGGAIGLQVLALGIGS